MAKSIISEGKTTQEAIENGLKILNCSKDDVEVNILKNTEKRSFFSILAPRVVKVELTMKEKNEREIKIEEKNNNIEEIENIEERKKILLDFLNKFVSNFSENEINYTVEIKKNILEVNMNGNNIGFLIGYRGETLNSFQTILASVVNNNFKTRAKVRLDIGGYKEKRKKSLEDLAVKVSKTVLKTGKTIKLEPMSAYERKIIHSKLQDNDKITTYSVGEEPHRRIVIEKIIK